jgi:phosphocarrier protein
LCLLKREERNATIRDQRTTNNERFSLRVSSISATIVASTTTATVSIRNRLGMHARPAMMFVETACKHQATIRIGRVDNPAEKLDGKSIMQVMMLAATQGTEILIEAEGADADAAVRALVELVNGGFQEE